MKKTLKASVFALVLAAVVPAADTGQDRSGAVSLSADLLTYIHNAEYDNAFREGMSVCGSWIKARCAFRPAKGALFSVGLFAREEFGDEDFLADIAPLFRARFSRGPFSAVCGELLYTEERHLLPDALLREEYLYDPAIEKGMQFVWDGNLVRQDLWVSFKALNTRQHREHISAGNATFLSFGPVELSCAGHIDHYGGQQYAPPADPVRDNLAGAAGVTFRYELDGKVSQMGGQQYIFGSYTSPDRSLGYERGWGSLSRVWVTVFGFMCRVGYYRGNNFVSWEGNSVYRSNEPYYNFEISRKISIPPGMFLDFGGRIEFVEMGPADYFDSGENVIWIRMGWSGEKALHDRRNR